MHEVLLSSVPLFRHFDSDELKSLAQLAQTVPVKQGETIFHHGDSGDSLYVIVSGHVELFIRSSAGDKVALKMAGPGDFFGELSVLDQGPRTASAAALEDSELLSLSQEDLAALFRKKPDTVLDLLQTLGGMIRKTNAILQSHVSKNPNQEIEQDLTWGQKIAQAIADFTGSIPFLLLNILFFLTWMGMNSGLIPGFTPFDPFPFGLLTMAVSLEAIILSIFVLLAQNLQTAKDRIRGDIEYEVNIKAELEIAHLHEKVDHLHAEVLQQLNRLDKQIKQRPVNPG